MPPRPPPASQTASQPTASEPGTTLHQDDVFFIRSHYFPLEDYPENAIIKLILFFLVKSFLIFITHLSLSLLLIEIPFFILRIFFLL